jgi:methanogenic corrinoid protein MtbC1
MIDYEKLSSSFSDLDENAVLAKLRHLSGDEEEAINAMTACQKGLDLVGGRFQEGEYFIADLIYSGEIMQQAVELLKPYIVQSEERQIGRMVFCTVEGDIHDIGKNIVKALLEAGGMDVIDLGVDVPADKIVECVKENNLNIVALSGVLTLAIGAMKKTVDALADAGLRDNVKVLIGGSPVNDEACSIIGADAWAYSPQESVSICRKWARL